MTTMVPIRSSIIMHPQHSTAAYQYSTRPIINNENNSPIELQSIISIYIECMQWLPGACHTEMNACFNTSMVRPAA